MGGFPDRAKVSIAKNKSLLATIAPNAQLIRTPMFHFRINSAMGRGKCDRSLFQYHLSGGAVYPWRAVRIRHAHLEKLNIFPMVICLLNSCDAHLIVKSKLSNSNEIR